jgi:hypothetical protein
MIGAIIGGIANLIGAGGKVVGKVMGNKEAGQEQESSENTAIIGQFAGEFRERANWFDSLIDGINRLPRPFLAIGVLGLMVWCPIDPVGFASAMTAYALVPEWLAALFAVIVGFYFAARHLEQRLKFKGPSAKQVQEVVEAQKALGSLRAPVVNPAVQKPPEPAVTTDDFTDETLPLSNEAIEAWNAKRR